MLTVYSAKWCPHCLKTQDYLKTKNIPFRVVDIEKASEEIVLKVIEVNGGDDWVVPTLEYEGKWRPGKVFNHDELAQDLAEMGIG